MAVKPNKKGVVTGTKNNDKITWTNSSLWKKALTVNAGDGNDTLNFKKSSYKNNKLNGGNGNDVVYGGTNIDVIHGNAGDDKLYGYNGNDKIYGDAGNDKLYGGNGDDLLNGGAGNDQLTGGKGKDKLYTGAGNDIVYFNSGDGADTLYKGSGADTLRFNNFANISKLKSGLKMSKSGNNLVIKYTSKDSVTLYNYFKSGVGTSVATLMAKDGKTIKFSDFYGSYIFKTYTGKKNKTNKITGSALNDLIKGNNKNDTLNGGSGNDKIYGYAGVDSIKGGNGNDYIDGGDGNDKLYGDAGNDTIKGGKGKDQIWGGAGNDVIYGNYDTNTLKGEAGNDVIYGGSGNDNIYGGAGNDIISSGTGSNNIYFFAGDGNDTVKSGTGTDTLIFKEGTNISATLTYNEKGVATIKINYGNSDSITLDNYQFGSDSRKYYQIGNVKKTIASLAGIGENVVIDSSRSEYYGTKDSDRVIDNLTKQVTINTGGGNDYVEAYYDTVYAGDGDDVIKAEKSSIYGEAGNDSIVNIGTQNAGTDVTIEISGGDDNDTITNQQYAYANNIEGDDGEDIITNFGTVLGNINGGTDNDSIVNDGTVNGVHGNEGNDNIINYDTVISNVYGDSGDDTIINTGVITENIYGGADNDSITNNGTLDGIYGNGGNDNIINKGSGVNDISGGSGNDFITNEDSATVRNIYGEEGNDTIVNSGMVLGSIQGGADDDSITNTSAVTNDILGGDGNDIITNEQGATVTNIDAGDGNNTVINNGTVIAIVTGTNDDEISNVCSATDITDNGGNNTIANGGTISGSITLTSTDVESANSIINNGTINGGIETSIGIDTITNDGTISTNIISGDGNDSITNRGTVSGYINAGAGNDIITTRADSSVGYILFNKGDGDDTLYLNAETNNLRFGTGITDFNFEIQENNLVIKYNGDADRVTIINYANNKDKVIMEYADGIIFKFNAFEESDFKDLEFNHDGTNLTITDKTDETKFMVVNNFNLSAPNTNIDSIICSDGIYSILSDAVIIHSNNGSIYNDMINYSNTTNTTITGGLGNDNISTTSNSTIRYIYGDGTSESVKDGNDNILINGEVSYSVKGCGGNDTIIVGPSGQMLNASPDYGIYGGAGDDVITVENGGVAQYIYGDAGVDSITVSGNIICADGGKGNDEIIIKEFGQVSQADGGEGNDVIYISGTVQDLYGGTGSDEITVASTGSVLSIHGDSDNIINCGNVSSIYGGRNGSTITNKGYVNLISGGVGNDTIITELNSIANCIELKWGYGHDTLYLNSERNVLYFDSPEISYSWSEDRKDLILSYSYRDSFTIKNFNYDNDSIYIKADEGNNAFLISNILYGIRGFEDVYFTDLTFSYNGENLTITDGNISKTVGFDMVYSSPLGTNNNIYAKNENGNVKAFSLLNDALISIPSQTTGTKYNDKITITENIVTSSGGLGNDEIIIANNGVVQSVNGEDGNDVIAVNGTIGTIYTGQGNDIITIHSSSSIGNIQFNSGTGSSILNFVDNKLDDLTFTYEGNDLILGYGNDKSVTIKDYASSTSKISKIVAQDGESTISELDPKKVYITSDNHPRVISIENNKALNIYFGEGVNIYDSYDSNQVVGIPDDEQWIYYTYTNEDNIKVSDSFVITNISNGSNIKFIYSDNSYQYLTTKISNNYLTGSNYNDLIIDTQDKNKIYTGDGDDIIYGLYGADNIVINGTGTKTIKITREDQIGNDVITFNAKPTALNIEVEEGIAYTTQQSGNDLVITFADYSWSEESEELRTLTLKNLYNSTNAPDIANVHIYSKSHGFSMGDIVTTWEDDFHFMNYPPGLANWLNNNEDPNDALLGIPSSETGVKKFILESYDSSFDEDNNTATYTFKQGDGIHTIYSGTGKYSYDHEKDIIDIIKFETELELSYSMSDNGKDLIVHYGEGDAIIIKDYFVLDSHTVQTIINGSNNISLSGNIKVGTDDGETITGSINGSIIIAKGGNDHIEGYHSDNEDVYANDIIYGGDGDDFIDGYLGNDYIDGGDGNDEIYSGWGNNTVYGGTGDDQIYAGGGNDYLYGDAGDDIIWGSSGNDYMDGGTGNNTFVYNLSDDILAYEEYSDGHDTIANGSGNDIIEFTYFENGNSITSKKATLVYSKNNDDLIIAYSDYASITLQNYFVDFSHSVKSINNCGTNISLSNIVKVGTDNAENITATQNNHFVYAKGGNDTIKGATNTTIFFFEGDGQDKLTLGTNNTLVFDTSTQLRFETSLNESAHTVDGYLNPETYNSKIYYGDGNDFISLNGIMVGDSDLKIQIGNQVKNISEYTNCGKTFEFDGNYQTYSTTSDSDNISIIGSNNTIYAGNGDNWIHSREGQNNTIYSGNGRDILIVRDAIVHAGHGQDIIHTEGKSIVYGEQGNDTFIMHDDTEYHFSSNDGQDTVIGFLNKGSYVFDNIENISTELNFVENDDSIIISYNNGADSVSLTDTGTFINGSSDWFYSIANRDYSQIYLYNNITPLINIKADGTIDGDWYYADGWGKHYLNNSYIANGTNTEIISLKGTINDKSDDKYLDLSNFNSVAAEVAGWLTEKGYADVNTAIIDDSNNKYTLTVAGGKYFGALKWQQVSE